ncbi:MAG TPA: hypothetical protein VJ385_06470 [Fibrobacteria bacterium]|nr:hypothetical protein [Fibrobacteria bacterium]
MPDYIKPVTDSGERPDWSPDGKRILFLNRSGGDLYEVEVATKKVRLITKAQSGMGCWRALYLSNGDYFYSMGSTSAGRKGRDGAYAYILDSGRVRPPTRINTLIREGPCLSRKSLKIAYTSDMGKIYVADIVYTNGVPAFANAKLVADRNNVTVNGTKINTFEIEPQNFVAIDETKLTLTAYGYNNGDALLLDTQTGKFTDFTSKDKCYDEAEGIFPDGGYSLVEGNQHICGDGTGTSHIDLYRFKHDGSESGLRLTNFAKVSGYKATNPVVYDDGKFFAFQEGHSGGLAGEGHGIYVYDLVAAGQSIPLPSTEVGTGKHGGGPLAGARGTRAHAVGKADPYDASGRARPAKAHRSPHFPAP